MDVPLALATRRAVVAVAIVLVCLRKILTHETQQINIQVYQQF